MKTTPSSLIAELDALFGKKPKPAKALAERKAANTAFHQRNAPASPQQIAANANALSRDWHLQPGWRAVARVTYIHHQSCRCCWRSVSYIANEFVEWRNLRLRATVHSAELAVPEADAPALLHRIEDFSHTVARCALCLYLSRDGEYVPNFLSDGSQPELFDCACAALQKEQSA